MADVTMTINADKTVSLSTNILGSQGEHVDVLVEVDQDVVDLGYQAYVDFLLPSGLSYYKGGYDCSSGSFSMGLGELDSIMDKDGEVLMQFWVGTLVSTVKTMHWSSYVKKAYVNKSIGATSAAILPYVPQMVYPDTYPAELISIEDSAGLIGATQVEQALAEIVNLINSNLVIASPVGVTHIWPFSIAPTKFLLMDGTLYNRVDYPDLWTLASSTAITDAAWATDKGKFSQGNGTTTFRVPDWSEDVTVGYKSGSSEFGTLGKIFGEKTHQLTVDELPDTNLNVVWATESGTPGYFPVPAMSTNYGPTNLAIDGGGLAHNNIQPSVTVNYIIRALK